MEEKSAYNDTHRQRGLKQGPVRYAATGAGRRENAQPLTSKYVKGALRGNAVVFASESCALDAVGAQFERDLDPGEIVVVEQGEVRSIRENCVNPSSHLCIFEYIYFARPDSVICGQSVHLAREHPVEADVVVGVPDSGLDTAMAYAQESGIPYGQGFVKNRYIGRTFITPGQISREQAVHIKLGPLRANVEGKRVVMIDDSIVRGTTCRQIVELLRCAGAKEVHMRVSVPPFIAPCYFGTDIPELIGADSLGYLSLETLRQIAPDASCGFCDGCFTGHYPISLQ